MATPAIPLITNLKGDEPIELTLPSGNQAFTTPDAIGAKAAEQAPVQSVNGKTGDVVLDASDISGVVDTTTDQSIAGVKTFSASPKVPPPTDGPDAANKNYVDAQITIVNQNTVDLSTDQTVGGVKTFTSNPEIRGNLPSLDFYDTSGVTNTHRFTMQYNGQSQRFFAKLLNDDGSDLMTLWNTDGGVFVVNPLFVADGESTAQQGTMTAWGNTPRIELNKGNAATDAARWGFDGGTANTLTFTAISDDGATTSPFMTVVRAGDDISSVTFSAPAYLWDNNSPWMVNGSTGNAGQVLTSTGNATAPSWQAVNDATAVKLTGNQTVAGVKTFSSSPIVPAPTTDTQAATKKYADDGDARTPTASVRGGVLQQAAIANIGAAPTQADFNGLLTALRAAGVLAT